MRTPPSTRSFGRINADRRRTGFTVVELTVVIAVIAVIISITLFTVGGVRSRARTAQCLSNQRQIAQACASYATANSGKLVSPRTEFSAGGGSLIRVDGTDLPWSAVRREYVHTWVLDRVEGVKTNTASVSGQEYELPAAITDGKLFPYLGTASIYVSPDEPAAPTNLVTAGIVGFPARPRSYSLNGLLGVSRPDETPVFDPYFTAPLNGKAVTVDQLNTTSLATIRQPQRMLCSVVEDDTFSFNLNGFIVAPNEARWFDCPAFWRRDAITHSYVDGSVDTHSLSKRSLPEDVAAYGHTDNPNAKYLQPPDGGGIASDWVYFRDRMNPGVIPDYPRLGIPGSAN